MHQQHYNVNTHYRTATFTSTPRRTTGITNTRLYRSHILDSPSASTTKASPASKGPLKYANKA
jgi:hypothetical protein